MFYPKKILIIRNDHIGDFVLSSAVFRELKKAYPKSKIFLITSKVNKTLIEKNTNVDEIWELEIPQYKFRTILQYFKMARRIKKEKFDVGIDLRGSLLISFLLLWLGYVKKRIGKSDNYLNKNKNNLISLFQTNPIKLNFYSTTRHITLENLDILNKGLGLNLKNYWPDIPFDKKDEQEIKNFRSKNGLKNYICICPFSEHKFKQWDINKYAKIIKWLESYNLKIVLIGTKDHIQELDYLAKNNKKTKIVIEPNLRKLFLLFKKSRLVIAPDIGLMHLAWASKAKTIEIVARIPLEVALGKMIPLGQTEIIWAKGKDINEINIERVKKAIKKFITQN